MLWRKNLIRERMQGKPVLAPIDSGTVAADSVRE